MQINLGRANLLLNKFRIFYVNAVLIGGSYRFRKLFLYWCHTYCVAVINKIDFFRPSLPPLHFLIALQ